MRFSLALVLLLPSLVSAQPGDGVKEIRRKRANAETSKWILAQGAPNGGFYNAPQDPNIDAAPQPSLRATNGAIRGLKNIGLPLNKMSCKAHAAFVLTCYDPKTGAFAEPGGKPDVTTTAIGVMVAMELGIPQEKFAKAMDYLKENAKTFEEVRIGAAAVEAWGVKDCPFKLDEWFKIADEFAEQRLGDPKDGGARNCGSVTALELRLGKALPKGSDPLTVFNDGQRDDGGWGKKGEKTSDIETTYRVMRALMLLKEKPKDMKKLREFIESHRNQDNGYATKPGDKSTMSGVYYCTIVSKWLDEMEAAKK